MALTRSLADGASSLEAQQRRFDVISNNIANSNTVGFKSSRVSFADEFNQVYTNGKSPDSTGGIGTGGTNPMEYGLGVKVASIDMDMSQGSLEQTGRPLDLALQGEGFFVYQNNGQQLYSRAGALSYDVSGAITDANTGSYLQGYNVQTDSSGRIVKNPTGGNSLTRKLDNLTIPPNVISAAQQTQNVSFSGNLDAGAATDAQRSTSINIYDSQGSVRSLGITFQKTANPNEYTASFTLDGTALATPAANLTFNSDGTLASPLSISINAADLNAATGGTSFDTTKDMTLALANANNLTSGLTQYSMADSATASAQDGYQTGTLSDLSVDQQGKIWGAFTNGQSEVLGQVAVGKFANPAGLIKQGNNFYTVSPNSGQAFIGTAGETFASTKVAAQSLEMSNVDLTKEFTDIISAQRAFEAAARTITVSDSMLAEINQLKR